MSCRTNVCVCDNLREIHETLTYKSLSLLMNLVFHVTMFFYFHKPIILYSVIDQKKIIDSQFYNQKLFTSTHFSIFLIALLSFGDISIFVTIHILNKYIQLLLSLDNTKTCMPSISIVFLVRYDQQDIEICPDCLNSKTFMVKAEIRFYAFNTFQAVN